MIAAFLALSLSLFIQTSSQPAPLEYGNISDLKNLRRVYIFTESIKSHDLIAKELANYNGLEVVGRIEDAEFILRFDLVKERHSPDEMRSPILRRDVLIGEMSAVVPGSQPNTVRILWHTDKNTQVIARKDPEIKCAQEFIKQLKKVRQEK